MRHKLLPTNPPLSDGFSLRPRRAEAEKQRQEASHARWAACQDHKTWLAEKTWRKQVRFLPAVWMEVFEVLPGLMYRHLELSWDISSTCSRTNKRRYIYYHGISGCAWINRRVPFTWVSGQGKKKNEEIQRKAREAAAAEEARKAEEERQRNLDQLSTKARGKKTMYFFAP